MLSRPIWRVEVLCNTNNFLYTKIFGGLSFTYKDDAIAASKMPSASSPAAPTARYDAKENKHNILHCLIDSSTACIYVYIYNIYINKRTHFQSETQFCRQNGNSTPKEVARIKQTQRARERLNWVKADYSKPPRLRAACGMKSYWPSSFQQVRTDKKYALHRKSKGKCTTLDFCLCLPSNHLRDKFSKLVFLF